MMLTDMVLVGGVVVRGLFVDARDPFVMLRVLERDKPGVGVLRRRIGRSIPDQSPQLSGECRACRSPQLLDPRIHPV